MFLDALVTARDDFEAELARHERALTGCVEEVRRDEHAARRDVALAVSAAVGGFASAAPSPPSPRPLPRDDDAPVLVRHARREDRVHRPQDGLVGLAEALLRRELLLEECDAVAPRLVAPPFPRLRLL